MVNKIYNNKLSVPGEVRGGVFKEDFDYIEKNEGINGLKRLKKEIIKSGYSKIIKTKFNTFDWYPLEWHVFILVKSKEIFNWTDDDIIQFGYVITGYTIFLKIFLKYFFSLEKAIKKGNEYWKQIYSLGDVIVKKADLKAKIIIFEIKNFKTHPILCLIIIGYLKALGEMILGKNTKIFINEINCNFKGGKSHEFKVYWK